MNRQKMLEWIGTHRVGISSRTMWCGLMLDTVPDEFEGIDFDVPHDADDFSRCFDLVTFAEVSPTDDFPRICKLFPWYKPILDCWDELAELFIDEDYRGVYDLLSSKREEVLRLQGYIQEGAGYWRRERGTH